MNPRHRLDAGAALGALLLLLSACGSPAPTMAPPPEERHVTEDYFNKQLATLQARVRQTPWSAWQPLGDWGHHVEYSKRDVSLDGIDLFCDHIKTVPYATFELYPSMTDGLTTQATGDAVFSAQYGDESRSDPTKGTGVILHLPLQCRLHTDKFFRQVQVRQSNRFTVRVLPSDNASSGGAGSCGESVAFQCIDPNQSRLITSDLVESPGEPVGLVAARATPAGGWVPAFEGHSEEPLASIFMRWNNQGNLQQLSFLSQAAKPVTFSYCVAPSGTTAPDGCEKKPNGGTITVPPGRFVTVRTAHFVTDPAVALSIELPP